MFLEEGAPASPQPVADSPSSAAYRVAIACRPKDILWKTGVPLSDNGSDADNYD